MPEHLECEVLQKVHYINTLTFTFLVVTVMSSTVWNFYVTVVIYK